MGSDEARRMARAGAIVEAIRVHQAQVYELTEELRVLLSGGASVAEQVQAYKKRWSEVREAVGYGFAYGFNDRVDVPHIRKFLKLFGLENLQDMMDRYHRDRDEFLLRAKHPHGLFVSGINRYGSREADVYKAPIINCTHSPRCGSDQEHTRRMVEDMAVVR